MATQGTATLDFGAFPGKSDASVAVASAGIGAGSLVEAWLLPAATADHTADEHMLETLKVVAGSIVAGVGFTIYGFNTSQLNEPVAQLELLGRFAGTGAATGRGQQRPTNVPDVVGGGRGTMLWGQWNVAWVWN
jgi:hypothetical protein